MRRMQALGRLPTGTMNKTEAAYAEVLRLRQIAGDVAWFKFEGFKLRLADNTFYTPDFAVMLSDGALECHEVKGFWTDDARVKIKVAADIYPFPFAAVRLRSRKEGGGWAYEWFGEKPTEKALDPRVTGDSRAINSTAPVSADNAQRGLNNNCRVEAPDV